jgi:hypothetical protein
MKYTETETNLFGIVQKNIILEASDGSFQSFPVDESKPEYIAFLAQLEADK